jgi:hypothetical protein
MQKEKSFDDSEETITPLSNRIGCDCKETFERLPHLPFFLWSSLGRLSHVTSGRSIFPHTLITRLNLFLKRPEFRRKEVFRGAVYQHIIFLLLLSCAASVSPVRVNSILPHVGHATGHTMSRPKFRVLPFSRRAVGFFRASLLRASMCFVAWFVVRRF